MTIKYLKYIPVQQLVEVGCNPIDILLASMVASFAKEDKPLISGLEGLAECVGVNSKHTAKKSMDRLQELGLVTIHSGKKKRNANQYTPTKKLIQLFGIDRLQNAQSKAKKYPIDRLKNSLNTPSKEGYIPTHTKEGAFGAPSSDEQYCKKTFEHYKPGYGEKYAMEKAIQQLKQETI